jgi:hypothetical protein
MICRLEIAFREPEATGVSEPKNANSEILLVDDGGAESRDDMTISGSGICHSCVWPFYVEDICDPYEAVICAATDCRSDQVNLMARRRRVSRRYASRVEQAQREAYQDNAKPVQDAPSYYCQCTTDPG